jgi:hypothetical protein
MKVSTPRFRGVLFYCRFLALKSVSIILEHPAGEYTQRSICPDVMK